MDLSFGTEADVFREELVEWFAANHPGDLDEGGADDDTVFDRRRSWNVTLFEAGYAAIDWPVVHGGRDASVLDRKSVV